jgi:hypothetical protein
MSSEAWSSGVPESTMLRDQHFHWADLIISSYATELKVHLVFWDDVWRSVQSISQIFPTCSDCSGVSLVVFGGRVELKSLDVWMLKSS